ncbi:MAG: hypothetical protein HRU20_17680 [Pseudomonadales bacterium]|nr:hypothetical protein [Pseudomonadales bacterium]
MKSFVLKKLKQPALILGGLMPALCISTAYGDAQLNPNQLTGTISFTNSNPAIQEVLAQQGLGNVYLRADSLNLSPVLNNNMTLRLSGGHTFDYQMTVESSTAGIQYAISADLRLDGGMERYLISSHTSAGVYPEPAADTLADIHHCAAMADVRFTDTAGNPVTVSGGYMHAWKRIDNRSRLQAQDFAIKKGSSQDYLLIEGDGSDYRMDIVFDFGDDFYVDKVRNLCQVEFAASCDEVIPVQCVVDGGPIEFGNIVGDISVKGETLVDKNHLTRMVATYGPYRNQRYDHVAGAGLFDLQNLVPSNIVDPIQGYIVYGEMGLRSGYAFQYLRTPFMNGNNGRVMVMPGQTTDLADTFSMDPGFINGTIELTGPISDSNALATIYRDADTDSDNDGIPNNIYVSSSHINAYGTNQKPEGAEYNSNGAYARAGFAGSFDSATGNFNGNYELVLGGLKGQSSIWALNDLVLRFDNSRQRLSTDPMLNAYMRVHNNQVIYRQIDAGVSQTVDHSYCFNDIQLNYKTSSGVFYNPRLRATGLFNGEDYRGQIVDYRSFIDYARGLPLNSLSAADTGSVSLTLPQGAYDITPEVTTINPDGSQTNTELPALSLEVGCGQVIKVSTNIQISSDDQAQKTEQATITVSGNIQANIQVDSIVLSNNQNPASELCNIGDCAATGRYQTQLTLEDGANMITVTATGEDGTQASVSFTINLEQPEPLTAITLTQCNDIRTVAEDGVSTKVSFAPLATGGCSLPKVTCDASSDDLFNIGNHTVSCTAVDTCDQTASCEFAISIEAPEVEEPLVIEPDEEPENDTPLTNNEDDTSCQQELVALALAARNNVNVLWSPNHELVPVGYSINVNHCDEDIINSLTTTVYSDESEVPGNGGGSGQHAADAVQTDLGLALRAERAGNQDGRVYLIISSINNEDESYTSCSAVVVPHDKNQQSLIEVLDQAKDAISICKDTGAAPEDFFQQGISEELGPKQVIKTAPKRHDFVNEELWSFSGIIAEHAETEDTLIDSEVIVETDFEEDESAAGALSTLFFLLMGFITLGRKQNV